MSRGASFGGALAAFALVVLFAPSVLAKKPKHAKHRDADPPAALPAPAPTVVAAAADAPPAEAPKQDSAAPADPPAEPAAAPPPAPIEKKDEKEPEKDKDKDKDKEKDEKAERAGVVRFKPGHGVTIASEDGDFSIRIRARLQLRETFTLHQDDGWENVIEPRRARLSFNGNVFSPDIIYKLQLGFGSTENVDQGGVAPLLDAWAGSTHLRDLNVKVGQLLVPFDRARQVSSAENQLVDRSLVVNELGIGRDVGLTLSSTELFGAEWLSYAVGVFNGEGRQPTTSAPPGLLYAGRVQVSPLGQFDDDVEGDLKRHKKPKLAIGVGAAFNDRAIHERSTGGGRYEQPFSYTHGAADAMFKWHGFSLMGEAIYRQALERSHAVPGAPTEVIERSRNAWGWFVQAGMMLTSQVEVASRYGELYSIVGAVAPQDRRELGGGASFYFRGHALKLQADYFRTFTGFFDGGAHEARLQAQLSL
jgi:phosphate-selective porin OprO and OprP